MYQKGKVKINSRQQDILSLLLQTSSYITLKEISDHLRTSIRTIQRELPGLDKTLEAYDLSLHKKSGVGIAIVGDHTGKQHLLQQIPSNKSIKIYLPEERQYRMKHLFLTLKEPTKLYYFSHKFNVAEATISNDLLKIESWFEQHRLRLVRRPGFGVSLEGDEKHIRQAMIELLYQDFSQEQLMNSLSSYTHSSAAVTAIHDHLARFIEPQAIFKIEQSLQRMISEDNFELSDSAYIELVIHIALALHRLKQGEHVKFDHSLLESLKETEEYNWANQTLMELGLFLHMKIPESEVCYITMHLLGSEARKAHLNPSAFPVEEYAYQMIRIVEKELKVSLESESSLHGNLCLHLKAAIHRIRHQLQIRNPSLSQIKETFATVFEATREAVSFLEKTLRCTIPEEEIGYLAMHFGASVETTIELRHKRCRALIVCTGGLGTSRLLAAQIEKKLPHIQVIDTVSLLSLEAWMKGGKPFDLIISTVPFIYKELPIIVVDFFLSPNDMKLIENHINSLETHHPEEIESNALIENKVNKINNYRDAMMHLIDNTYYSEPAHIRSKETVFEYVGQYLHQQFGIEKYGKVSEALEHREQQGGWVLSDDHLAILHCRSDAIDQMYVILVRLGAGVNWGTSNHPVDVRTVLVLLIPAVTPQESIEIMSEISAAIVEEPFVTALSTYEEDKVKAQIKFILERGFLKKTTHLLR
ncbi:PRD domain-containing protein [Paenibacillus alkaliterrae]|uniref:BglG family transcription antiterminator n=1 Tax=Paenibacillus alkaliterrae TaxID=320909 RepID=UPI001F3A48CF|nr:PRD domain-containing protein [Paenibacillus alkaliterrae]MCF2941626.1 PRD domain-containing protein [Paenibacillus alkaliterrae]